MLRAGDGHVLWTKRLTTGFLGAVFADGILFGALTPLQFGPVNGVDVPITALRSTDGITQWQVKPGGVALPLGVVGSTLFVAQLKGLQSNGLITDTALLALATADGHTLWSDDLGGLPLGLAPSAIAGSSLATNGSLVFLAVAHPPAPGSATQGKVMAVRASDGGIEWAVPIPKTLDGGVTQVILGSNDNTGTSSGNTVYVAGIANPPVSSSPPELPTVLALDASNGNTRWTHQFTSPHLAGTPPGIAADDQQIYAALTLGPQGPSATAGPSGEVVALRAQTGDQVWQTSVPGPTSSLVRTASTLYVSNGIYGSATGPGSAVAAYQTSNGKQLWSVSVASPDARITAAVNSSVIVAGSVVGTPGPSAPVGGFVQMLTAVSGTRQWTVETSSEGTVQVGTV
jgi:outer membrane protein assembly factor BamB